MSDNTLKQIGFALLTFAVYTFFVSWQVALLLMVAVGFHEYSHLWAAKRMGLHTKGFYLVPFVGGVALVADRYKSLGQQAFVVLAGPVGGGLLAAFTALVYYLTGCQYPFLASAAAWMGLLNLFNLLPFSFMDGGQLLGTITYSINRTLGFVCLSISTVVAAAYLLYAAPILGALIVFFGGASLFKEFNNWNAFRKGEYYLCSDDYLYPPRKLSPLQMVATIGGWFAAFWLLFALIGVMVNTHHADMKILFGH